MNKPTKKIGNKKMIIIVVILAVIAIAGITMAMTGGEGGKKSGTDHGHSHD